MPCENKKCLCNTKSKKAPPTGDENYRLPKNFLSLCDEKMEKQIENMYGNTLNGLMPRMTKDQIERILYLNDEFLNKQRNNIVDNIRSSDSCLTYAINYSYVNVCVINLNLKVNLVKFYCKCIIRDLYVNRSEDNLSTIMQNATQVKAEIEQTIAMCQENNYEISCKDMVKKFNEFVAYVPYILTVYNELIALNLMYAAPIIHDYLF